MNRFRRPDRRLVVLALAASMICAAPAFADELEPAKGVAFYAGTVDLLASVGFSNFLYPHVEGGLEVGVYPVNEDFAIGVGAGVDVGWCLLCALADAVSDDIGLSSSYWTPQGRVSLHVGTLFGLLRFESLSFTLDPYAALQGGPSFYSYEFTSGSGKSTKTSQTTFLLGPVLGVRTGHADNTWLAFAETRYQSEFGFASRSVTVDGEEVSTGTGVSRDGQDYVVGVGVRF